MLTARMSKNGQVVIPSQIRKMLNLSEGDVFQVENEGEKIVFSKMVLQESVQKPVKRPENVIVPEPKPAPKEEKTCF